MIWLAIFVAMILVILGIVVRAVFEITIQGKMTGGLSRKEAWKEIGKELFRKKS